MTAENRQWGTIGVPSINDLIEQAEYMLNLVFHLDNGFFRGGGLEAFYDHKLGLLRLKYVPEDCGRAFSFTA